MDITAGSDAELIVASWDDPSRFADIFGRHYRAVYAYAVRAAGVTVGEDIAAEVFVRAFASRRRFDPAYRSARPWLLGIAARLVADHYRRSERYRRAVDRATPSVGGWVEFEDDAARRLDAAAAVGPIDPLLAELRPEERDVVALFSLAELSYEQIAEALAIPIGTVKSRLHRARGTLRNLLSELSESIGEDDDDE
jgi:RNA polymerase sigma-70 factor (ECF subfamily)